ncbi:MAG: 2-hydroxyacyl-CoA dehydratase [Clostridiales bacterium]|nr:2-hydroxyacyl-CoA dehydratase [Clostridiales bacterium]
MAKGQLWETRPLEFWAKAKELRAGYEDSAKSTSNVVAQGNWELAPAFPALTVIHDNPIGSMIQAKNDAFARKARLASEIRGWGRELCGYVGTCWGCQFLGYLEDGSPWQKRQLVIPHPCQCDQHAKRGQQARDFENMPQWGSDACMYVGEEDDEREKAFLEHNTYCNLRVVNDIERIFGQQCDDEKLVQVLRDRSATQAARREITRICASTIPSPLSVKDTYSIFTLGGLTKVDPEETNKFWRMVVDEVKWRADNHIAAVANERFRWIEAHPPSWHYLKYYRYMEDYGAVCMGSQYSNGSGMYITHPDGTIEYPGAKQWPEDTPIETREDFIRVCISRDGRASFGEAGAMGMKVDEYIHRDMIVKFAKFMQADGALLAIWRHGVGCTLTRKEQAMYLKEAGLSVMHYEGSQPGDRTDLDEHRLLDQLDHWMQSLGLRKFD